MRRGINRPHTVPRCLSACDQEIALAIARVLVKVAFEEEPDWPAPKPMTPTEVLQMQMQAKWQYFSPKLRGFSVPHT